MRKIVAIQLLYLVLPALFLGCSSESGNVAVPAEPTFDELVYQNCLQVQAAAEAYAEAAGEYPYFTCGELNNYLPDSMLLVNPRTKQRTEPVMFEPSDVGSVSYRVYAEYNAEMEWNVVGYYIVGHGLYEDFILTNIQNPEVHIAREQVVIDNVLILIDALNNFINDNQSVYPADQYDETPWRWNIVDYFPDTMLLLNPYTSEYTEPSIWTLLEDASSPGQISYGYLDSDGNGIPDGCIIQAISCYPPHSVSMIDKGHWIDNGYLGMSDAGWCTHID